LDGQWVRIENVIDWQITPRNMLCLSDETADTMYPLCNIMDFRFDRVQEKDEVELKPESKKN
jgi:hypothetical protein